MQRTVEAEWLDSLPASDPRAERSRRDLRVVNRLMGNAGAVARSLELRDGASIVDLGSGDGTFMARVAAQLRPRPRGVRLTLVDRGCPASSQALTRLCEIGWEVTPVAADAADWLRQSRQQFDAVAANLFLHHLDAARLRELLSLAAARTDLFVAREPRRSGFALWASRTLLLAGCGPVTRHDAAVSVRAGFRGRELSDQWPRDAAWELSERSSGLFSHLLVARRLRRHARAPAGRPG